MSFRLKTEGYKIDNNQARLLEEYLVQVIETNKTLNLTRINSLQEGYVLHLEDSLVALPEFLDAPFGKYADIGTGGGFPGVPLSIATKRDVLLIDSVSKKINALNRIIATLGLENSISTYAGRAEELALSNHEEFSIVTARALSSIPALLELSSPLLKIGGRLISYKAQIEPREKESAAALETKLGMKLVSERETMLSDKVTQRAILVYEKIAASTVNLPRRPGMAQKRPYKA